MTDPLPSQLESNLKAPTAWRFDLSLGKTFKPRFFCCTDPNELGIVDGKEPVAIIEASANTIFTGGAIAFDGSNSYDPDGSITDYSWSFAGGSPSSGTAATDNVTFGSTGRKTIRLTVTDGTGKRSVPATRIITVQDAEDVFAEAGATAGGGVYAAQETGISYSDDSGQSWSDVSGSLSGDELKVNDISQDPASYQKAQTAHILWIATDGGVFVSVDGGSNWTDATPTSALTDPVYINLQWFGDLLYTAAYSSTDDDSAIYYADVSGARSGGTAFSWGTV